MLIAQGIPLFEAIPWKSIAVPALILGLVLGFAYEGSRFAQGVRMIKVMREHVEVTRQTHTVLVELLDTAHSLDEIALSSTRARHKPNPRGPIR